MKIFEKLDFLNFSPRFFEKKILCNFFHNKLYFLMSNMNLECLQLSFDVHIVHVDQKL